eukprot:GEMP01074288.1.p1 GENE.GEMP01074288.1~~GEMP01074288.1.p1  ORF type:complete len:147 (+),score=28.75 GEMP01074288.1:187-627(+)
MHMPSGLAECQERPEVEVRESKYGMLKPVVIRRDAFEKTFIEVSVNSVRISIKVRQSDDIERSLVRKYTRFLTKRAGQFEVLRRVPVEGYDLSFLITADILLTMKKCKIIDFIIDLLQKFDSDIKDLKLKLHQRLREAAGEYAKFV